MLILCADTVIMIILIEWGYFGFFIFALKHNDAYINKFDIKEFLSFKTKYMIIGHISCTYSKYYIGNAPGYTIIVFLKIKFIKKSF